MKPNRSLIIAEAGVNHNGSIELALQLVDAAAGAGADAVKFQTFRAEKLVSRHTPKAAYQQQTTDAAESQLQMIKKLELTEEHHRTLVAHCAERGILFLSTPFDVESLDLLCRLGVPYLKLPSGEITNAPLLIAAARTGLPIILSTGMSRLGEVELALAALAFGYAGAGEPSLDAMEKAYNAKTARAALREKVTLLHCTTEYPAPLEEVNLRAMGTLREAFGLDVGYSDHTSGITIPVAAAAMGAAVIEKHFTLDRSLPGPDHKASLEPGELREMVEAVRQVGIALGEPIKAPTASEIGNRSVIRKSLVAARPIGKGERFTEENLAVKRPGGGISPFRYWEYLGRQADRDYQIDEIIRP